MSERVQTLIRDNIACLYQGLELLTSLSDSVYDSSPVGLSPHRAGGHLRHCLEFYECFFAGVETGFVDYDGRRRDSDLEHKRGFAIVKVLETIDQLNGLELTNGASGLLVRVEGEEGSEPTDSSIARELGFLLSHTIHHFALMAMTLQALGIQTSAEFGVSPSTLRRRAEVAREEAAVCAR